MREGVAVAAAKHRRMTEPIAQRTLVKSPPELWAEISDVEALARHLGAFGEIRITRVVPETTVSWEGETARGTVELSAAGWGTKVTLRATATGPAAADVPASAPLPDRSTASVAVEPVRPATPDPRPDDGERILRPPSPEPHWSASVEQKVRDRYVGSVPHAARRVDAPQDEATRPTSPSSWPRDEPLDTEPETAPLAEQTVADTTPAPAAAPQATESEPASPSADARSAPHRASSPPRGFLARIRWWFGTPTEAAEAPDTVAEPAGEPATADAPAAPNVLPFPSAPPSPAPVPEPLPEPLPAAATHAAPPPLAASDGDDAPTPQSLASTSTDDAPAPQPLASTSTDDAPAPTPPAPVDEGTIVGILTGVLDELGSAHHRPFSRG